MELPVTLKNSVGNSASLGNNSAVNEVNKSGDSSFSGHYEKNINSLKNERRESSAQVEKKPEKPEVIVSAGDSGDVKKEVAPAKLVRGGTVVLEQKEGANKELPIGLLHIKEEMSLIEQAPGLSTAIGVISAKRTLETEVIDTNISGNELPQAAEVSALAHDELVSNIETVEKDIIFDPLSQVNESSAQIAALTSGQLAGDKVQLNGKNNAIGLLGETRQAGMPTFVLERMNSQVENVNIVMDVAKEVTSSKAAAAIEAAPINVSALTQGAVSQQPLTEKASIQLDTPMGSPKWGEGFSQRVQWMVNQSMNGAQIRLNPQSMGPIEVRIQMQNEQATVSFTAQHGATREAIDAALPRLREMLSEQNVNVVEIDVSEHSFAEQREQASKQQDGEKGHFDEFAQEEDRAMFDQPVREYNGLFSEFA